ncbi:MAG TPA: shikimate dehydrogenase, partial [Clostridia bacterium]|nr:shikimate dehydrogenase [Clostridia bacterium]
MEKFAFIIHPLEVSDISRKFSFAKSLPPALIERLMQLIPPIKVSHITGIRSQHDEAEGWFLGCPLTARLMMELPEEYVLKKIIKTAREAQKLGAKIVGLGAFTAVVGDAGETVAKNLDIAVTTGNSYTIAAALDGTKRAATLMGHNLKGAKVVVVGATGSIGRVCATILARDVTDLTLVARNHDALKAVA